MSGLDATFRALLDRFPALAAYWGADRRCRYANHACEAWLGIEPGTMIGRHIREVLGPIYEAHHERIEAALRGEPSAFTSEVRAPQGTATRWLDVRYHPDVERDSVQGFAVVAYDITERRNAELTLGRRERDLREAERVAHMGLWEWDAATDTSRWSDELYRIYGRDLALGPPNIAGFNATIPPEQREHFQSLHRRALTSGEPFEIDRYFVRPDGTAAWIWGRAEAVRDASGTIVGLRGVAMDVTSRKDAEVALRRNEALLHAAQRVAKMGSWEWDRATGQTRWSDELFRIFGRDPRLGPPVSNELATYYRPEDLDRLLKSVRRALATGEPYEQDTYFHRPDGTAAWIWGRGEVVRDAQGAIVGLHGITMDITARKEAELALRKSEAELHESQRIARVGSWDWDIASDKVTWSRGLRELYDWNDSDALPYLEQEKLYTPASWRELTQAVERAVREGVPYVVDLALAEPIRGLKWVRARGEAVRSADGKITGLHGVIIDTTEQREAEAALRESEGRYALIARNTQDVIWLYDLVRSRFDYVSPSVTRLSGHSVEETMLLDVTTFLPTSVLSQILSGDERGLAPLETVLTHHDGKTIPVEVLATPVRDASGRITHVQGVTRDISNRKRLEQQVSHLQKMESVGRLAGGVAHDFNNLLMVILGQVEYALTTTDASSETAESLREALNATRRSADLTKQLLTFARRQEIAPRILHLNDQVEEALTVARRIVGDAVVIDWIPGGQVWPVSLDPVQLQQVLTNLIVNARDAVGANGRITIATDNAVLDASFCAMHPGVTPGEYVELMVNDTGLGMRPEVRARVFEPFFTTKEYGRGTGLGLAIVHGIVSQNSGHITVESEPGRGTTFRVWFPRAHGETTRTSRRANDVIRGHETILVVEDEGPVLRVATGMLTRLGYRVLGASNATQAIELLLANRDAIDLVLSDVVMPQVGGPELIEKLRAIRPDLPHVFMSGFLGDALAHEGIEPLLRKPFSVAELASAVRSALAPIRPAG